MYIVLDDIQTSYGTYKSYYLAEIKKQSLEKVYENRIFCIFYLETIGETKKIEKLEKYLKTEIERINYLCKSEIETESDLLQRYTLERIKKIIE